MPDIPPIPDRGRPHPRRDDDRPPRRYDDDDYDRRPRRRGRDNDREGRSAGGREAGLVAVLIVCAVCVVALVGVIGLALTSTPSRPSGGGASQAASLPVVKADLDQLLKDWRANPVATLERYRGRAVEVTGEVKSIDAGEYWKALEIKVRTDRLIDPSMTVTLPDAMVSELRDYPRGSQITVQVEFTEAGQFPRPTLLKIVKPDDVKTK